MRRRVLNGSILLVILSLVLSTLLMGVVLQRNQKQEAERDLRQLVGVLGTHLDVFGQDLDRLASEYSALTGYRVTVVDEAGGAIADSDYASPYELEDLLKREEFVQARLGNVGVATRASVTVGRQTLFAAVYRNGDYQRLGPELAGGWGSLALLLPALLLALVLVGVVIVPVTKAFTASIQKPIEEFSQSLGKVMEGGEKLDPELYPYEELQSMALSINQLSKEVDEGILRVEAERQRLDAILDSMKEGFLMLDWADDVLMVNATVCHILQYVPGDGNRNLVYVTRDIAILDAVAEVKKTGTVQHVEYQSESGKHFEVAISPSVGGEEGRGVVLLFSDMADMQSNAKMRQEFFQSASHELKTPITSVRGFAEILMSGAIEDEVTRVAYAGRILKETRRMEELIEDILMIARMESGEIRYEREDIDLGDVVESCCEEAAPMAAEAEVALSCEAQSCRMYASPKQMQELVGNLVSNALKYNYPGGRADVRLWIEDGSPILRVFNTGEAIRETETERIFERFYRVEKGRSKTAGGTGLGLAIAKHICGTYGAKISLIPNPGLGNTFEVVFPPSIGASM